MAWPTLINGPLTHYIIMTTFVTMSTFKVCSPVALLKGLKIWTNLGIWVSNPFIHVIHRDTNQMFSMWSQARILASYQDILAELLLIMHFVRGSFTDKRVYLKMHEPCVHTAAVSWEKHIVVGVHLKVLVFSTTPNLGQKQLLVFKYVWYYVLFLFMLRISTGFDTREVLAQQQFNSITWDFFKLSMLVCFFNLRFAVN